MKGRAVVLAILLLGFFLRLWGIGFGLPDLYHADEPIVVNHAVAYGTGDFHPHFFKIPPLVSYLLFGSYGIYYLLGRSVGWFGGIRDFQILFLTDPTSFYLVARLIFGALLGTLTVFSFYGLIKRHFSRPLALVSSSFLATAFLHVRDSHYIYVDIPLLFVLVVCFHFILKILERGERRDYFLFGILGGTAVATKYNGVFIFVPFLAAHLIHVIASPDYRARPGQSPVLKLLMTLLVSLITFGLLNPFSWLDGRFFLKELLIQGRSTGAVGALHHLNYSLMGGVGIPLCLFSLAGLFYSLLRPEPKRLILASFILIYYLLLTLFSQAYDRYVLPLVPFLLFFAADLTLAISERVKFSKTIVLVLTIVLASPSLAKVLLSNRLFSAEDVRTIARTWIETNLPPGSRLALDIPFFMPRLKPTIDQLEEKKRLAGESGSSSQLKRFKLLLDEAKRRGEEKRYQLYFLRDKNPKYEFLFARPALPYQIRALEDRGIAYVVTTSVAQGQNTEFYQSLREEGNLIARFSPYKDSLLSGAIDRQPLTGGPFLWRELVARERNGQSLEVYSLE